MTGVNDLPSPEEVNTTDNIAMSLVGNLSILIEDGISCRIVIAGLSAALLDLCLQHNVSPESVRGICGHLIENYETAFERRRVAADA